MSPPLAIRIAHLSDLHLRDAGDVAALERQLACIASRSPVHLAITGDLLDRWNPALLRRTLDALAAHGFRDATKLTLLHGNHDLASGGGHPRARADLWRLALRFWDPPPLVAARLRRFYREIERWSPGVAASAPFSKLIGPARVAVLNTVPMPWRPLLVHWRAITVRHAIGCIRGNETQWLGAVDRDLPLVLLLHHYPLAVAPFSWRPHGWTSRIVQQVNVPMAIPPADRDRLWRAVLSAGTRLVLCGHVHRARLDWKDGVAIGLNGQSGAEWAGRTIALYTITADTVTSELIDDRYQNR